MNHPEPQSVSFSKLMQDIENGLIKLPQFQRDFVWTTEKSAKLLDSIVKGYPVGTFILWKTKEQLRSIRNLGNAKLHDTPKGDFIQYVLDGQQRLTSLFASINGLKIERNGRVDDFSELYIDLLAKEGTDIVITDANGRKPDTIIRITDLLNKELTFFTKAYPDTLHKRIEDYKLHIRSYAFSAILLTEAPIDVATEVFTRINVSGRPLSVFEVMVAKTFDKKRDFDLAEKHEQLMDRLKDVDYDTIAEATILQAVSVILTKECNKKQILKLNKTEFIDVWDDAADAIERTVDYFRQYYRIPVSRLLPYNALIVPFAYFFSHHKDKPTGEKQKHLQDFFWRCSLGGRYSSAQDTKLGQDIRRIDQILKDRLPKYDFPVDVGHEFIQTNGAFSTGRSFVKAILCIYAYQQPKSFNDNSIVSLSNDYLKQANSRNYHHFFPKAFLKKQGEESFYINHVLNITLVDDFLNKRLIRDKSPKVYMKTFLKENPQLKKTMKTHLVDLDTSGVWNNDFDRFFVKRAKAVSRHLEKRLIPQDVDTKGQKENPRDYEELEMTT